MSRVGQKIKEARLSLNMTQKLLAKKLGLAEKYINEIEIGRKIAPEDFIDKVSKVLNVDFNDVNMIVTDEEFMEEKKQIKLTERTKKSSETILEKASEVWTDAFSSVLKKVNIYDYNLKKVYGTKDLPIYSNKIEGYPQDKVLYLKIEDNDMSGFRIMKGDIAFCHMIKEASNNGIFLIEYNNKRIIRQIKKIGNSRILLINNDGSLVTETVDFNSIKVIANLKLVEFELS